MGTIHSTAIVEDGATLGAGVEIGPFCHVGASVVIGEGTRLRSHVSITGDTRIGSRNDIFPFAVLGGGPQSTRHGGGMSRLIIGDDCVIREGVTANTGTDGDKGTTSIGDKCFLMTHAHIAHDCVVGTGVTIVNNVMLAGHCQIGDHAIIGGGAAMHQFTRIGRRAFVGGLAGVEGDVIPFGMALGNRAYLGGLNIIGLKRSGLPRADIHDLRHAYEMLFSRKQTIRDSLPLVRETFPNSAIVAEVLDFIENRGKRALVTPEHEQRPAEQGADG